MTLVIGLTGGIAMGKSHAAALFRRFGVPVFDADAAVHALFRPPSKLPLQIERRFPSVLDTGGGVDRRRLGAAVFENATALRDLEGIVHPAVFESQLAFMRTAARSGIAAVVLDIPLLFENGGERRCDLVIVVEANPWLQRQRAMARSGMTASRLDAILAKQMPAPEKRRRADFVLHSGYDRGASVAAIRDLLRRIDGWPERAWPDRWLHR